MYFNLIKYLHGTDCSVLFDDCSLNIRFQEIVPLNAGNVLVIEDNEPAAKWLALINQSLNKSCDLASRGLRPSASLAGSLFFSKHSLKKVSKTFRVESGRRLKTCNCTPALERKQSKDFCFRNQQSHISEDDISLEEDDDVSNGFDIAAMSISSSTDQMKYSLIASKQMVGIFVTVWVRKELVQHVGHLRISCISRGIMGCLRNKVLFNDLCRCIDIIMSDIFENVSS